MWVTVHLPQLVIPPVCSATGFLSQPLRSLGLVRFFGKQQCALCENALEGCEAQLGPRRGQSQNSWDLGK